MDSSSSSVLSVNISTMNGGVQSGNDVMFSVFSSEKAFLVKDNTANRTGICHHGHGVECPPTETVDKGQGAERPLVAHRRSTWEYGKYILENRKYKFQNQ